MNFGPDNIQPVKVDSSIRFSSIGGLKEHIKCLREMIIFPLMYPELFAKFKSRPAKGVLFHGPPGTGKTLLARALASECSLVGGRRVAFFMRKGADCLNKYYGESEKNLRMLFEKARKMKPSIIFFDEIDALAPARRASSDSTTHDSVVATLLAELDGLCDRGDVIVIGATNRPDAMDPAVRRAGRFDRELYFPPPEVDARRDIFAIYTRDWEPSLSNDTLDYIAKVTVGYLGSDIKSLCSEAVLRAVRRVYPQIYECDYKLLINAKNVEVTTEDLVAAMEGIVPANNRSLPAASRPLPAHIVPLLQAQLHAAAALLKRAFPAPATRRTSSPDTESASVPSVFLLSGECAETFLAPALLAQLEHCVIKELSLTTLHSAQVYSPEQAVISLFAECRRTGRPCVIFIRDLLAIWEPLARKHSAAILLQLWRLRSVGDNTLLLATCQVPYEELPIEVRELFPAYLECVYRVRRANAGEVRAFLAPVLTERPLQPPPPRDRVPPPLLPRAPPPGPRENEDEMVRRLFHEYDNLRLMRSGLRAVCRFLVANRRYVKFTIPVDTDVLPDYSEVIKDPMDLTTVMSKIDDKEYYCAKEFLSDIDLICTNALLYNRSKSSDKKCREEAAALYTDARTMVMEEIDAHLELECQLIARRRRDNDEEDGGTGGNNMTDVIYFSKLSTYSSPSIRSRSRLFRKSCSRSRRSETCLRGSCPKKPRIMSKPHKDGVSKDGSKHRGPPPCDPKKTKSLRFADTTEQLNQPNNVLINRAELEDILKNSVDSLCNIGLEALIDLQAQLSKTVEAVADNRDRSSLPAELRTVVARFLQLARR